MKWITYEAPDGATISLSRREILLMKKTGTWPRNESGEYAPPAASASRLIEETKQQNQATYETKRELPIDS